MKFFKVSYPAYQISPSNRLLSNFLDSELCFDRYARNELVNQPATNVYENDQAVEIEVSVPGYEKEQLTIAVEKDLLRVKGEVTKKENDENRNAYLEFRNGSFEKKFRLSEKLDSEKVHASFKNGVLTITVSKKEDTIPQKREVEIS